jgi:hypothetical protein
MNGEETTDQPDNSKANKAKAKAIKHSYQRLENS